MSFCKLFLLVSLLFLGKAQAKDDFVVALLNGQADEFFELESTRTHTEYRVETQAKTCSRKVLVGYQTQCHNDCGYYPWGYSCVPVCGQVPIYRTEFYTCYVDVKVPYVVVDQTTTAKIQLDFTYPLNLIPRGKLQVSVDEWGTLNYQIKEMKDYIAFAQVKETTSGSLPNIYVASTVKVNFVPTTDLYSPVLKGIEDFKFKNGLLSFTIGEVKDAGKVQYLLKVYKSKVFKDQKLIEVGYDSTQVQYTSLAVAGKTRVSMPVSGVDFDEDKKYRFQVEVRALVEGRILNKKDLPQSIIEKSFKMKF